jgi:hypothetical protein
MKYRDYLQKYIGQKAHFDFDPAGYYHLDFTGRSYSNVDVLEVNDEFILIFEHIDKTKLVIPYTRLLIRFSDDDSGGAAS